MPMAGINIELDAFHFAIAGGGIALAVATALWALAERRAARAARRSVKTISARARAAVAMRDTLLAEGHAALVVWDRSGQSILCQHGADQRLRECLDGPDAACLVAAIEALDNLGEAFTFAVRAKGGCRYAVRGQTIGANAAVWLEEEDETVSLGRQLTALLDALPLPVWLRGSDVTLRWGNRSFLSAAGAESIEAARAQQAAFDKAERALAESVSGEHTARETERYALVAGAWRSYVLMHLPLEDGSVAAIAVDRSRAAEVEFELKRHLQNQAHLLGKLPSAVAVFGADRRLMLYNMSFATLWGLDPAWLEAKPTHDDFLDRLREMRRIPEQRDFLTWKRERLALYAEADREIEETWPLADGTTLSVVLCTNPLGGLTMYCEDVSEKFALESSLKILVAAQSATLDVLSEAVAAFGPDGRLALHNAAFAEVWDLDRTMLAGAPHVRQVAKACLEKFGDEAMWDRLVSTVSSGPVQRRRWRKLHRADGTVLSLSTVPLPDRATLVTFEDVTHAFGIETALRERNEALEMVDRLRADYIKRLSHELRTPLNTVLGFAEHLTGRARDAVPESLREPLEAIVTGGYVMKNVMDEMLAGLVEPDLRRPEPDAGADLRSAEADSGGVATDPDDSEKISARAVNSA